MFCANCGTKQGEGEKFCPNCGTKFEETTVVPQQIEAADTISSDEQDSAISELCDPICSAEEWFAKVCSEMCVNHSILLNKDINQQSGVVSDMYSIQTEVIYDKHSVAREKQEEMEAKEKERRESIQKKLLELRADYKRKGVKRVTADNITFKYYLVAEKANNEYIKVLGNLSKMISSYNAIRGDEYAPMTFNVTEYDSYSYKSVFSIYMIEGAFLRKYIPTERESALKKIFLSDKTIQLRKHEEELQKIFHEIIDLIESVER